MPERLYRSSTDRVLGGVCGGVAKYFDRDPLLVRILCVVLCIVWGAGILAYIIAWILIPEEPTAEAETGPEEPKEREGGKEVKRNNGLIAIGAILIALGVIPLMGIGWRHVWGWVYGWHHGLPIGLHSRWGLSIALIILGMVLIYCREK